MAGSPLKQPPSYPGPDPADEAQPQPARKTLFAGPAQPQQPPSRLAAVLGETTYNVRRLPAPGTDPVKTKERDALREELARLRRDLDVTARQNERIRAMQAAGRRVALSDEDQVVDILRRHLLPEEAGDANKQKQSTALAKAALDPMALVGFGRSTATSAVPAADEAIDLSDIKSHHPLPMTAEEELPFLQLFTPFDMTPTLSLARGTGGASGKSPRQLFSLRLRSRDCPGLFTARVDVIVDAARMSIQSVEVAGLEPAARAELGPFLDRVCAGECNRSMQRNVGIVAWAMAEWLRVAERRARFWAQLHAQTGTAKRLRDMARSVRAAKRSRRSRDRDSADTDEGAVSVAVADLLRFMGEQSYDVQIPGQEQTSLRLTWGITFDWTGEAKSKVAVMVGVPGKCEYTGGDDDVQGEFMLTSCRAPRRCQRGVWTAAVAV